jgi:hypothetical protein
MAAIGRLAELMGTKARIFRVQNRRKLCLTDLITECNLMRSTNDCARDFIVPHELSVGLFWATHEASTDAQIGTAIYPKGTAKISNFAGLRNRPAATIRLALY